MRSFTVAGMTALLLSHAAAHAAACDAADLLRAQARHAEAQKLYVAVLKADPAQQCARTGLEAIAKTRADAATHWELAHAYAAVDKEAAKRETLAALSLGIPDPATQSPAKPAAAPATDPFEAAKRLAAAGLHDKALEKLAEATAATPEKDFPKELRYLTGPAVVHFVKRYTEAVFIGLVIGGGILLWLLRRKLHPRLNIEDLEESAGVVVGKGAALYLQQQLIALTRLQSAGVGFVTAPITQVTVPADITSSIPTTLDWIKPLLGVLSSFYWRRVLTLSGCVHPAIDKRGVGLTLVLQQDKKIVSTSTIWQEEYGTSAPGAATAANPSPWFDLAEPAAIWLLFQLLQLAQDQEAIRRAMGTADWKSYAANAAGVRARRVSSRRAMDLILRAITFDSENAAPRANLGTLLQHSAGTDERQLDRALEQLKVARPAMSEDYSIDPVFYSASYCAANIHYTRYARSNDRKELQDSVSEVRTLVRVMKETERRAASRPVAERERVRNFISAALPTVDVMRIGVEAELGEINPAEARLQLMTYERYPVGDTQYNLACTYSLLASLATGSAERFFYINDALEHLAFALHLEPLRGQGAEADPSLATVRSVRKKEFATLIENAAARLAPPAAAPPPPGNKQTAAPETQTTPPAAQAATPTAQSPAPNIVVSAADIAASATQIAAAATLIAAAATQVLASAPQATGPATQTAAEELPPGTLSIVTATPAGTT
jgi:hypothetical protein